MRGKLFNIKNILLTIFIVGSIFYAPHASAQDATITSNITTVCTGDVSPVIKFTYTGVAPDQNAIYTFTYSKDGATDQTIATTAGNTTVDLYKFLFWHNQSIVFGYNWRYLVY